MLEVLADGQPLGTIATKSADTAVSRHKTVGFDLAAGARRIALRPIGDGPVDIADHRLVGARPGITLANLGFSGAQVGIMGRWDWPTVTQQILALDPALIIVAFGTNEGFGAAEQMTSSYAGLFEQRLRALMAATPNASLVVVGPPDANRYPRYCLPPSPPAKLASAATAAEAHVLATGPPISQIRIAANRGARFAAFPPRPPPEPPDSTPCVVLSPDERRSYDALISAQDRRLCRWHTPAAIPIVREAQRRVAARLGVLFWDWGQLFEGECGADLWARTGLAHKDRVHFKQDGYARAADRLFAALLSGYGPERQGR